MPVQWSRLLGLLPDAQSRSSHLDAGDFGRVVARGRRSAPALYRLRERAGARNRAFVPGPVRLRRHGREPLPERRALSRLKSGTGALERNPRRLAVVERAGSSRGTRRCARQRPVLELAADFADLLALSLGEQQELEGFENRSANGRPLGDPQFLALVEGKLGRTVRRGKPGPKPKHEQADAIGDCVSRSRQIPGKSSGDCVSCPRKCPEMCIMSRVALKIGAPRRPNFIYKLKEV